MGLDSLFDLMNELIILKLLFISTLVIFVQYYNLLDDIKHLGMAIKQYQKKSMRSKYTFLSTVRLSLPNA